MELQFLVKVFLSHTHFVRETYHSCLHLTLSWVKLYADMWIFNLNSIFSINQLNQFPKPGNNKQMNMPLDVTHFISMVPQQTLH